MPAACAVCGGPLPPPPRASGRRRVYCSERCKVEARLAKDRAATSERRPEPGVQERLAARVTSLRLANEAAAARGRMALTGADATPLRRVVEEMLRLLAEGNVSAFRSSADCGSPADTTSI